MFLTHKLKRPAAALLALAAVAMAQGPFRPWADCRPGDFARYEVRVDGRPEIALWRVDVFSTTGDSVDVSVEGYPESGRWRLPRGQELTGQWVEERFVSVLESESAVPGGRRRVQTRAEYGQNVAAGGLLRLERLTQVTLGSLVRETKLEFALIEAGRGPEPPPTSIKSRVPVSISAQGAPRDGYLLGDIEYRPREIEVEGPPEAVRSMREIRIAVDVRGADGNLIYPSARPEDFAGTALPKGVRSTEGLWIRVPVAAPPPPPPPEPKPEPPKPEPQPEPPAEPPPAPKPEELMPPTPAPPDTTGGG